MSTSERSLLLKRLIHGALVDVCQVHFTYIDFVHVTGRLVFNVDNRKTTQLTISEIAEPSTFDDASPMQALTDDATDKTCEEEKPCPATRSAPVQEPPTMIHRHELAEGSTVQEPQTMIRLHDPADRSTVQELHATIHPHDPADRSTTAQEPRTMIRSIDPPGDGTCCGTHTTPHTNDTPYNAVSAKGPIKTHPDLPGVDNKTEVEVKKEAAKRNEWGDIDDGSDNEDISDACDNGDHGDNGDSTDGDDRSDTGNISDTNTEIYDVKEEEEIEASQPHNHTASDTPSTKRLCNQPERARDTAKRTNDKGRVNAEFSRRMTCAHCCKGFTKPADLRRHVKAVHEKRWSCPSCDQMFQCKTHLKRHMRKDHGRGGKLVLLSCQHCKQKFVTQDSLKKHEADNHVHACSVCDESFALASRLCRHREQAHRDIALTCRTCGRLCSTKGALRKHRARHVERERGCYSCDQCGKKFTAQSTLYHHKRGIHSAVQPYHCKICDKRFNFNHSLKLHLLRHKGERPHACKLCDKAYMTASHLKNHVEALHGKTRRFQCPVCGKSFPYDNSLRMHLMLHTGTRPFLCSVCNKGFVSNSALLVHKASHVDGKPHECDTCHKHYKTPMQLRAHRRRHTADGTRFMCDICGCTFMYQSNLEAHAVVHGDQRVFSCKTCDKSFKTYATLYSHQLVHRADVPYMCAVCDKSFKTKERLRAHEKRHLGLKPFVCTLCGSSFPDKGGLSKHTRSVHAANPLFACPVCAKGCNRMDNLRVHMKVHGDASLLLLPTHELLYRPDDMNIDRTVTVETSPSDNDGHARVTGITVAPCQPMVTDSQTLLDNDGIATKADVAMSATPQYAFYSTSDTVERTEPSNDNTTHSASIGVDRTLAQMHPSLQYYGAGGTVHVINRIIDNQHLLTLTSPLDVSSSSMPVVMSQQPGGVTTEQCPVPYATLLPSPSVTEVSRRSSNVLPMTQSISEQLYRSYLSTNMGVMASPNVAAMTTNMGAVTATNMGVMTTNMGAMTNTNIGGMTTTNMSPITELEEQY